MPATATAIDRVTVYKNGALVVRRGEGAGLVEVDGLPLLFSSDSLRVRPARGSVRDLEESVRLMATPAPPPVNEAARVELALAHAVVDDQLRAVESLLRAVESLSPETPDPRRIDKLVDAAGYVGLVRFAAQRIEELLAERQRLNTEKRKLEEQGRKLDEREVPDATPPVITRGCRFSLTDGAAFEVEYFVAAARWVPTYSLELTTTGTEGPRARLACGALVAQATGEDWGGVRLAVSTADLLRETNQPPLSSWRIGRAQPARTKAWRPLPSDLPSLFRGFDHSPRSAPDVGAASTTPPAPPPPPMQAPRGGESGNFDKLSTDELRSFEKTTGVKRLERERERRPMDRNDEDGSAEMVLGSLDDDMPTNAADASYAAEYDEDVDAKTSPASISMPMPAAKPMAPMRSASAPAAPGFGGGGALGGAPRKKGGAKDDASVIRVKDELPARWRTAYMRMAAPLEPQRGRLVPLDPIARLSWLLDAHDVDGAGRSELNRAIHALASAQNRLEHTPLPKGTSALLGTHFFAVFEAREKTDVPGDGTFYRVEVRRDDGPAVLEHRCVPRESYDVWRFCRLDVKGIPLPAGPLAVYEDGAFKVNARLDGTGGGKPLEVNLGVDPDVRVVGRTVHTNQLEKGLVGQTTRVEHKVKVELRSTRKQPANVVIYDRLPHAADNVKDVNVVMLEEKPPAKRTNKDAFGNDLQGALEWRVTVMPGDLQSIAHSYAVDLPAKTELEGGNRRE